MHGDGAADVNSHMVGVNVPSDLVGRTNVPCVARMHIGHLNDRNAFKRGGVAELFLPFPRLASQCFP